MKKTSSNNEKQMKIMKTIFKIMKDQWNILENILKIMKTNKHKHGFQEKKRVPCEKSGRHSTIYLALKPLNILTLLVYSWNL